MLDKLREVDDRDLQIQCDVFFDEKQADEDEMSAAEAGLDLNSHTDVFNAIYDRVG